MKGKVSFSRILHYLWPQMKKHLASFSLIFLGYTVGIVFNNLIRPLFFEAILDLLASGMPRDVILSKSLYLFILICISLVIYNIGYRLGDFAVAHFESKVMKRLYDFTFEKLLEHSYNFFSNNFSGSLIAKSKRLVRSFEILIDVLSFQIWFSIITTAGICLILFFKVPALAWAFLIWSIVYLIITLFFIKKKTIYDGQKAAADSLVTARLSDAITNILNIKIFSTDKIEGSTFRLVTASEEGKRRWAWQFANIQNLVQAVMMMILQILVVYMNIHLWYEGKISLGVFVLVQSYLLSLFDILWNLGKSLGKATEAMSDMQEVVDIFDTPIDIVDSKKSEQSRMHDGHIEFKNVSFSYKGGISVLNNFNLNIQPGERIGLVGHSGAGKSTITKILLRFSETQKGSILIDGQDITNVTQNDLRRVVSYVPQEPILFHRSIRDNIAYSKEGATNEEVIEVAKKAHAHDFIVNLKHGYDTLVGERGIKLSGGERQRVAIARAMLKDSPVLVLDEATSSLDSISESYIQDAFTELMKGKTTIVIAHRLSTIQKMDRIIVLDKGAIAEEGTHKELLEKNGMYKSLWDHQTGGFLEE